METLNQIIFEIRDNMSLSLIIFDMVVVIATTMILCSNWAPALLGGEWFTYKVKDKLDGSSYVIRTKTERVPHAIYEYELESGPIYEGSNKLIHVVALLVLPYFSFWFLFLAWLGIWLIFYFAPIIYFWYAGGFWQNIYEYNPNDYDRWNQVGPTKAKDSKKLEVRNYGSQKWLIYYVLFFITMTYFDFKQPIFYVLIFLVFIVIHSIVNVLFLLKENSKNLNMNN